MRSVTVARAYDQSLQNLVATRPGYEDPQPVAMLCRYEKQALRPTYEAIFDDGGARVLTGEAEILTADD